MPDAGIRVPPAVLKGALALIGFTFASIALGRHYNVGMLEAPAVVDTSGRDLIFQPQDEGGMAVLGNEGDVIARLVVEGDSFAITAVQALVMQRGGAAGESPYRLRLRRGETGRLDLHDPVTGRKVPLIGFGPDNIRAFSVYLSDAQRPLQASSSP